jgi:Adenosine specific kinase
VDALWKAYCQFPYLPRLASFDVLAEAITDGVNRIDWHIDTFAYADGHDGTRWVGLATAQLVSARRSEYVVSPDAATEQKARDAKAADSSSGESLTRPVDPAEAFLILLRNAFPINVLPAVRAVQEVCGIYCATSNPVEVVVAETEQGRGVLGVVDVVRPRGIETDSDIVERMSLLRRFGYKLG